jgi:hypothetical protein
MALASLFPDEVMGKGFQHVIDKVLYPIRVHIAHAISSQSGELTLTADELLHTQNIHKWLPLTKCIVRRMLKNDFPGTFFPFYEKTLRSIHNRLGRTLQFIGVPRPLPKRGRYSPDLLE